MCIDTATCGGGDHEHDFGSGQEKLESQGHNIVAAIPTVVSGKDHAIHHVLGGPSIIIPFELTSGGAFYADICLETTCRINSDRAAGGQLSAF